MHAGSIFIDSSSAQLVYPTLPNHGWGLLWRPGHPIELEEEAAGAKGLAGHHQKIKSFLNNVWEQYAVSISCQTNSRIILYESPCYKTVWNLKWIFCDRLIGNNRLVHPGIFFRRCATWQSRWGWSRPSLLPSLDPRCKLEIPKRSSRLPRLESHAKKSIATMHAFPSCPQTGILSLARSRWKRISISLWGSLPPLQRASLQKLRLRTGLGSANKIGYDTSCVIFFIKYFLSMYVVIAHV